MVHDNQEVLPDDTIGAYPWHLHLCQPFPESGRCGFSRQISAVPMYAALWLKDWVIRLADYFILMSVQL